MGISVLNGGEFDWSGENRRSDAVASLGVGNLTMRQMLEALPPRAGHDGEALSAHVAFPHGLTGISSAISDERRNMG